jgi:uncharacterized damage-inducible protein DinB
MADIRRLYAKKDDLMAVFLNHFHHKGQIMSMCRQLGYPPPETDVYRSFY